MVILKKIYIEQPRVFVEQGKKEYVYLLRKALQGLKQAPHIWYEKLDSYLLQCGFKRRKSEATLYVKLEKDGKRLVTAVYVDDIMVTGDNKHKMVKFKEQLENKFEISNLGETTYFLGIEIQQTKT